MRCSRQWRNLKHLIHTGLAHEPLRERSPGDMALFCVACPQPGVNLPPENERDVDHPWVMLS